MACMLAENGATGTYRQEYLDIRIAVLYLAHNIGIKSASVPQV